MNEALLSGIEMTEKYPPMFPATEASARTRLRRKVLFWTAIAVGAVIIWRGPHTYYSRRDMRESQRKCMDFSFPEGRVVWDDHPQRAALLAAQDASYKLNGTQLYEPVEQWQKLLDVADSSMDLLQEPLFVGSRRIGSAPERLIVVLNEGREKFADDRFGIRLGICVTPEITMLHVPDFPNDEHMLELSGDDQTYVRFFAGQRDPSDSTLLKIRYESGDQAGEIWGRLKADDTVEVIPYAGPGRLRPAAPRW